MDKKQIQQTRMMNYFLDAACKIIEEEGYKELTVRKVADLAGYHYSTIYNYFKDLNNLAAQATLKFFDKCYENIAAYAKGCTDELEQYKKTWEGFCVYCLDYPEVFRCMFIEDMGNDAREVVISSLPNTLLFIKKRESVMRCAEKNFIPLDKVEVIEEILLSACLGRVIMHVNKRSVNTKEDVIKSFKENMEFILDHIK